MWDNFYAIFCWIDFMLNRFYVQLIFCEIYIMTDSFYAGDFYVESIL